VSSVAHLALRFVRAKWALDLQWRVEVAASLDGPWTAIDPADPLTRVQQQDETPAPGLETLVVRDPDSLGAGPRFIRLRVRRP
jgi:hypothetical protein